VNATVWPDQCPVIALVRKVDSHHEIQIKCRWTLRGVGAAPPTGQRCANSARARILSACITC